MLRSLGRSLIALALLALGACATPQGSSGILTSANVSVSNGRTYVLETYFAAADHAALRQTRPNGEVQISGILGTLASTSAAPDEVGGQMLRTIVLGHQFRALLLNFDAIHNNLRAGEIEDAGERRATRDGDWPYGGVSHLVLGAAPDRPTAFVFKYTGAPEIRVAFSDWREAGGETLPFHIVIDDGSNRYDYSFTVIATDAAAPDWAN
ncbi:hypothetical protein [Terricaulis silvestris]|uniref:Lipoprotein n=1 Tax=Terricaulis silvestris TaxID=2686094 RepID=A0A6I6MQP3_9CAUL|nr:hypothetical protein [Terricaulis silvestris]QGZ95716.1 hypothetical protein DSM104635_02567 [Terricaulis silvestris]